MICRRLQPKDWEEISQWYLRREGRALTSNEAGSLGYIVEDLSGRHACGFLLWPKDTKIAFIEFVETNPEKSKITQAKALRVLTVSMRDEAKRFGIDAIIGLVPEEKAGLMRFYRREGATFSQKNYRMLSIATKK